jgi:hypothetical protein
LAGVALYIIGRKQVAAVNRQNDLLQRGESSRLARMVVSAGRVLDGILQIVANNLDNIDSFGSNQQMIGLNTVNQIPQQLAMPPRYEVIPQLEHLGREIINDYFLLCTRIDHFRTSSVDTTAASLHEQIEAMRMIVDRLREEIGHESHRAQGERLA